MLTAAGIAQQQSAATSTVTAARKEVRAGWFSNSEIRLPESEIARRLHVLKDANFNTACFDFQLMGNVGYSGSAFLPQDKYMKAHGDILAFAIEETHRLGMRAELVAGYGFIEFRTPPATTSTVLGLYLSKYPDRAELDSQGSNRERTYDGKAFYVHMCPANPANHQFLAGLFAEAVARYPADGIVLSGLWYRSPDVCHCSHCKRQFKASTGVELEPFPAGSEMAGRWADWKRERLTDGAVAIVRAIQTARPGIRIAVHAETPSRKDKCQSWNDWLDMGIVDEAVLHLASCDGKGFEPMLKEFMRMPGTVPSKLICAVGSKRPPAEVLSMVEQSRQHNVAGVALYTVGRLDKDDFYVLRDGPYNAPVESPLGLPMLVKRDADVE